MPHIDHHQLDEQHLSTGETQSGKINRRKYKSVIIIGISTPQIDS